MDKLKAPLLKLLKMLGLAAAGLAGLYFVIEADPAGFEARIRGLMARNRPGGPAGEWKAERRSGPGKDLWSPGESLPSWWDVRDLPEVETVDIYRTGGHAGEFYIFARSHGRIYVIDR